MNIEIKLLDVKNADAVLVHLSKDDNQLVFVIDSGRASHHHQVLASLEEMLKKAGKVAPDFIICSHYDNDHIGGILALIEHYKAYRPMVWMHKTSEKIDIEAYKKTLNLARMQEDIFPSEKDTYLGGAIGQDQKYFAQAIKNVEQEEAVIKRIATLEIECKEPLVENFKIEGWPEITLVSPSFEFYQQQFPKKFTAADLIKDEVLELKNQQATEKAQSEPRENISDPFGALDQVKKSKITATNMNSAMLMIESHGKKFLFAADAGIAAFKQIDEQKLTDLYWLKVPHHGSGNNLNAPLIKVMKPRHASISGGSLIAPEIIACFQAVGSKVLTTRDDKDITFKENLAE
jgi:beta-lactamase superfamily II metal-dependent hydrolase